MGVEWVCKQIPKRAGLNVMVQVIVLNIICGVALTPALTRPAPHSWETVK